MWWKYVLYALGWSYPESEFESEEKYVVITHDNNWFDKLIYWLMFKERKTLEKIMLKDRPEKDNEFWTAYNSESRYLVCGLDYGTLEFVYNIMDPLEPRSIVNLSLESIDRKSFPVSESFIFFLVEIGIIICYFL